LVPLRIAVPPADVRRQRHRPASKKRRLVVLRELDLANAFCMCRRNAHREVGANGDHVAFAQAPRGSAEGFPPAWREPS
jgi:hypothetical protein